MAVNLSPTALAALQRIEGPRTEATRSVGPAGKAGAAARAEGPDFGDVLVDAMRQAGDAERQAEKTAEDFANGKAGIHETIMAQERAGISVRYAVTVKNKALEAYRELMNTQV